MPETESTSRNPTFFHWARDKPCTTNAVYGWSMKREVSENELNLNSKSGKQTKKTNKTGAELTTGGPTDGSVRELAKGNGDFIGSLRKQKRCSLCRLPSSVNGFDINRGYVMGHVPVTEKIQHGDHVGVRVTHLTSVPDSYEYPTSRAQEVCLWHSLAGTLVHCKNYEAPSNI